MTAFLMPENNWLPDSGQTHEEQTLIICNSQDLI
jgi:hypothetical protein